MNQAGLSSILVAMALLAIGVILAGASESSTPPFEPFRLGSRDSS